MNSEKSVVLRALHGRITLLDLSHLIVLLIKNIYNVGFPISSNRRTGVPSKAASGIPARRFPFFRPLPAKGDEVAEKKAWVQPMFQNNGRVSITARKTIKITGRPIHR
jgi:hypothetical protein